MSSIIPHFVCSICEQSQPLESFYIRENGKRRNECKACSLARRKAKRDANLDDARAKATARYHERKNDPDYIQMRRDERIRNRDKNLVVKAKYHAANREKINAKANEYYHQNREQILQRENQRRRENPEQYREKKKRSYWRNRDHILRKGREWRMANPDRKRNTNRRWYLNNRSHVHEKSRKWRAANLEHDRAMRHQWFERNRQKVYQSSRISEHRRRAQTKGQTYRWQDWQAMCDWFGNVCLCCGCNDPLTVDHVIPLIKGGSNFIENLQPLCRFCNQSKNGRRSTDYRDPIRLAAFLASIGHSLHAR